ncbi:hypothetical protein [Paractinoplanes durhamensis]|uniref:Uncharacterized protein n=1 Tax=Paractinoplanes durhamensis TaxID=113563 RepID=A0ABQ3Z9G7_9ACTN|nr:hypothetical protein [Actinoplanes durhamensis]GIE06179.1 hypothetical protein Adu01nite_75290 [Actinoplanes durhamensis]
MDPLRPKVSPNTVKQFAHGELVKDTGTYVTELVVERADYVFHHHLGGGASAVSRQFRVGYEIGAAGDLTVWSVGVDPQTDTPDESVKRIITYGPHGWLSLHGPARQLGHRPVDPSAILRDA